MSLLLRGVGNTSLLERLASFGGLTFFKSNALSPGEKTAAQLAADYAGGSKAATFTASRGASNPATYIDQNGIIRLVTASNTGRITAGFYNSTGFVSRPGLIIEKASTNLVPKASVIDDATWTETSAVTDNADTGSSSPDDTATAPSLTASAANGTLLLTTAVTARTFSVWLKRKTGTGTVNITANGGTTWVAVTVLSTWARFQVTASSASQKCGIQIVTDTDAVYVWGNQFETSIYATSFIPTTSAALTRNSEKLSYVNSGNRTAATESIFIKFTMANTLANDALYRSLLSSDTIDRAIYKDTTANTFKIAPNVQGSVGAAVNTTFSNLAGVSYVMGITMVSTGDPNTAVYSDGAIDASSNVDFTAPAWGANFYIGGEPSDGFQPDAIFQSIAVFSDTKSDGDVLAISNLMAGA